MIVLEIKEIERVKHTGISRVETKEVIILGKVRKRDIFHYMGGRELRGEG